MSGNTSQLYRFKSHRFECLGGVDSLNRLSRFEMNYENLNDIDSNYLKVIFREKNERGTPSYKKWSATHDQN